MDTPEDTASDVLSPGFPLKLQPEGNDVRLVDWVEEHREWIESQLLDYAAILFRGFDMDLDQLEPLSGAVDPNVIEYVYRSTPRTSVGDNVYTATEYPADQQIPQHNENSYARDWPMKLLLYCEVPADEGGHTPLARNDAITENIPDDILEEFRQRGVMYNRNYRETLDLSWQESFSTDDKSEVERMCEKKGLEYEWRSDGSLRTSQSCQGMATHPKTGETFWFNQANLFHVSSLPEEIYETLSSIYEDKELPRNAYWGDDGSPISEDVLGTVRAAIEEAKVSFPWQAGDVVLVDNMLTTHGRQPYKGDRDVFVAMAEPFSSTDGGEPLPDYSDEN